MITLLDEHPEMPSESDGAGRLSRTVFIAGVLLYGASCRAISS